jgi:MYXO-CTERM domain-containing protein
MTISSPEIDAGSATGAVALLSGGLLILRARRRSR